MRMFLHLTGMNCTFLLTERNIYTSTYTMIEKLSRYIKSSGKDYKDHYVTILNWYEQDREKLSQKDKSKNEIPNYDDSPTI